MLALWVEGPCQGGARERFLKAIEVDAIGSERMSRAASASTSCRTGRTRTSTISARSTATRRRWRRIVPRRITPSGAPPRTRWTARPRRRAAIPYFPRRPITGSANARLPVNRKAFQPGCVTPAKAGLSDGKTAAPGCGHGHQRLKIQIITGSVAQRAMPGAPGRDVVRQGHRDAGVIAHQGDDVGDADMPQCLDRAVVKPLRRPARIRQADRHLVDDLLALVGE